MNKVIYNHLHQFVFQLGISTITSTMYTQSTLVYNTVISTSSTTNTSLTLCTAGMSSKLYIQNLFFNTVAIPISIFFSSLLTAIITMFIFCLIMRRRSYNKDTPPTTTTQLGPIYDDVKSPEASEKDVIELQGNTAYGYK